MGRMAGSAAQAGDARGHVRRRRGGGGGARGRPEPCPTAHRPARTDRRPARGPRRRTAREGRRGQSPGRHRAGGVGRHRAHPRAQGDLVARQLRGRLRRTPLHRAQTPGHPLSRPHGGGATRRGRTAHGTSVGRPGVASSDAAVADVRTFGRGGHRTAAPRRSVAPRLAAAAGQGPGHARSAGGSHPGDARRLDRRGDTSVRTPRHRSSHGPPPPGSPLARGPRLSRRGRGALPRHARHARARRGAAGCRQPRLEAGVGLAPRAVRGAARQLPGGAACDRRRPVARRRPGAAPAARWRRAARVRPRLRPRP